MDERLHIGTCSWKYDSWRGLVYSDAPRINYLAEYAQRYDWSRSINGSVAQAIESSVSNNTCCLDTVLVSCRPGDKSTG